MSHFDSIVFLQQFNDGYPMTIEDMAAAFYVEDPGKKGDGDDKIATIECHNSQGIQGAKDSGMGADKPDKCNDPVFKIKR